MWIRLAVTTGISLGMFGLAVAQDDSSPMSNPELSDTSPPSGSQATVSSGDDNTIELPEWAATIWHQVDHIWNMRLMDLGGEPLTIGKIILGCVLLLIGLMVSRLASRIIANRLQTGRFKMNQSGAAVIQSLSFYCLLAVTTLTALQIVNVPLTAFTFMGGAIAIGVGFGCQNIINNFISGLILLAERPIKVGDLVQIDDLFGNVERIGTRSTRIRTGTNLEIIVPNSTFLENNVINLTLGDTRIRTQVNVGVAYGSPTRDVERILKTTAVEHERVLQTPEPFVWFAEFADNTLNFELHFWVSMRAIGERRQIESDLRHRIDELFEEAGIVIAFPQRDVHLFTEKPVEVKVIESTDRRAA